MTKPATSKCTVDYADRRIVLTGDPQAIHAEAQRILNRFCFSPLPYRVVEDAGSRMVLAAA